MGLPAARITDAVDHRAAGNIIEGSPNVHIGKLPAARLGDKVKHGRGVCVIVEGDPTIHINNRLAARLTDKVSCGGFIASGCPSVHLGIDHRQTCLQDAAEAGTMTLDMPNSDGL